MQFCTTTNLHTSRSLAIVGFLADSERRRPMEFSIPRPEAEAEAAGGDVM